MTREEAIEILKPFMACMYDQHGCPISDAAIALEVAISALEQPEPCEDDPKADVYYLAEKIGIHRLYALVVALRGEPEMHHCCNCGRTVNNGGWYDDGRTRCPIEEHYQLPKDGYCHLWEKTKPWEDEYEHHSA